VLTISYKCQIARAADVLELLLRAVGAAHVAQGTTSHEAGPAAATSAVGVAHVGQGTSHEAAPAAATSTTSALLPVQPATPQAAEVTTGSDAMRAALRRAASHPDLTGHTPLHYAAASGSGRYEIERVKEVNRSSFFRIKLYY